MFGKPRFLIPILACALLAPAQASAGYQFYRAEVDEADWKVEASSLVCRLVQHIPDYGEAMFSHRVKGGLEFSVMVKQPATRPENASLRAEPPEWKHYAQAKDFGGIPVIVGKTPFYLNDIWARRLLMELEEGMDLRLNYKDWSDGSDEVDVRISALNFSAAWSAFQECEQGLLQYDFNDVRKAVILYGFGETALPKSAQDRLDLIIGYIKKDPRVRRIRVDGYTDSKGLQRINITVAKRRVAAVKRYFLKKGIPAKKIITKAHSEIEGKFSNRSESGRRKNRRVEIKLIR